VTQITVDANGMRASGVLVATLSGRRLKVIAGRVILASGALETTRLLLASNAVRPAGVGNAAGLVGRFYQSHLEGEVGEIQFDSKPESVRLDYERSPEGVYCRRYIWLSPDAQRREHLAGMVLRPHHPKVADPAHGDPVLSAMYLVKDLVVSEYGRGMNMPEQEAAASLKARRSTLYLRHLTNVVLGSPHLLTFAVDWVRRRTLVSRKLPSVVRRDRANRYVLDVNAEQIPNRDSQVRLSEERDSLGMPRLEIDWRITPQDQDNIARGMRVIQAAFARRNGAGGARVCLPEAKFARQISGLTRVGGHHIGTARMGRCPDEGVVDANCEAFDLPGLFVAGAAVLPTSGFANPMLVTLALTLRLADHIAGNRG
jgi:choline dehydrogenase-like flavoprotein